MKILLWMLAALLAMTTFGCNVWRNDVLRRATFDMRCPESQLEVTQLDGVEVVGVRGCGRRAVYNAYATPSSSRSYALNGGVQEENGTPVATPAPGTTPAPAP